MSVLKVGALKSPSASSNNIVLNSDGTISSGGGGAIPSNTYITGTFVSNNYFENEKVILGSFLDISDYNLSSLGGSLIHASANGGIGGNTYSIPSTASAVYIWVQGAGGDSGSARTRDAASSTAGGNGGGGSKVATKITIAHQPHTTLSDLYFEFNPQGDAVVYIGTSNSGVEIARGYKGLKGEDVDSASTNIYGESGDIQTNASGVSVTTTGPSSFTQTTITSNTAIGTLGKHFPKFIGSYVEHGATGTPYEENTTTNQGVSGRGLFSEGLTHPAVFLGTNPADTLPGVNAHAIPWAFGVGAVGPHCVDMAGNASAFTVAGSEGGYACAVIIVR